MSKYKFKITYRNENKYGQYWGDNRYTVSIIAETIEQAKQKLDEIEKNDYDMHKNILTWEADEIIEEKDKEIDKLTFESTKWESKFYDEAKKVDRAIEFIIKNENNISSIKDLENNKTYNSALLYVKSILQGSDKE